MGKINLLLMTIFLISFISATLSVSDIDSIGTFQKEINIELYQTCNNCTYCNFTVIKYPNATNILTNIATTKDGTYYSYTLNSTYLENTGEYIYCYDCGNAAEAATGCITFEITYTGKQLSDSSSTMYIVLFATFIFLFIITLFGINQLPESNTTDQEGTIIKISYLKYLRPVGWMTLWMLVVALMYLISNVGFAYLEDAMFATFFFNIFKLCMGLTLPIVIIWFIYLFAQIIDDKNIRQLWERGMFPQKI